jgi:hypothetical protein
MRRYTRSRIGVLAWTSTPIARAPYAYAHNWCWRKLACQRITGLDQTLVSVLRILLISILFPKQCLHYGVLTCFVEKVNYGMRKPGVRVASQKTNTAAAGKHAHQVEQHAEQRAQHATMQQHAQQYAQAAWTAACGAACSTQQTLLSIRIAYIA